MADIKTKDSKPKSIKIIDKTKAWTERIKDPISYTSEEVINSEDNNTNLTDYGEDKIKYVSNRTKDESIYLSKKSTNELINYAKRKYQKKKLNKNNATNIKNSIEKQKKVIKTTKNSKKIVKKSAKINKKVFEQGRRLAINGAKKTIKGTKIAIKTIISSIKNIIAGIKSLIGLLSAGGGFAVLAIIIICLVGLLVTSVFGIFFSGEEIESNAITMKDVIADCNQEFSEKLETIQNQNNHDEYVLDGNMASWKDILLIYTVKLSNGINEREVITVDDDKKAIIKNIFWDMNEITSEVKKEYIESSTVNTSDTTTKEEKQVLHIYINSKTANEMLEKYNLNSAQLKQYNELASDKYSFLWNGIIYGNNGSGKYVSWKQKNPEWANIKMGNSSGTIGSIGCLVTSISILIEKSGANTMIKPFNPGTFVNALNNNNGFENDGSLKYSAITKVVPNFKYIGNINLRNKTKEEKLFLIKQYLDLGYYIATEVKGATPGRQHWVAITDVEGNNVLMIDPSSEQTNMWNAYKYTETSQFNYFKSDY